MNEHVRIGFNDTIRFYQSGQLYKQVIPMNYSRWPIKIKDFPSGTYKVTYTNLYGQTSAKTVVIPDTSEYELALCPDELTEYTRNSLASLQNGEIIKVNFSTQGCFHGENAALSLSKQKDAIVATLTYGGRTKSKTLNNVQLEAFKRFENELAVVEGGGGCTTTDTYTFVSKTTTLKKIDGGCSWKGFYILCRALFGKLN